MVIVIFQFLKSFDIFFEMSLKGNSNDIVKIVSIFFIIKMFMMSPNIGDTVKLICYFSCSSMWKVIVFFTVEVKTHEVNSKDIANVFLSGFISVEKGGLIVSIDSSSGDLVDFDTKWVIFLSILVSEMNTLYFDADIIEEIQK